MSIERICVIGAGTMGAGIAHVSALAGYETSLQDVSREVLDGARATIERRLDKGVDLGKVEPSAREEALGRLRLAEDLGEACEGADLVIEAVPERMELKKEVLGRAQEAAGPQAMLATNTSGLSVTELAAGVARPETFLGMHFFNPVHIMKLVEIVRGLQTSDEAVAVAEEVARRMGKKTVVVADAAGFVTSRVNAVIGNEAFRMLEAGTASAEDIDRALKLGLNHPMGPFELVDLVGLDVRLGVMENLHATLGEAYRPSPLLRKYVEAGRLGRKTGRGVYRYDEDGRRIDEPNEGRSD